MENKHWNNDTTAGRLWIRLFWMGIAGFYFALFALFFNRVGLNDNDQFLMFHELQFWNARLFGFSKQWTPVLIGGISLAGDPQVPLLSLSMMLSYVLGPFYGLRVATALYFVAGWWGAWLYAGLALKRWEERALAASLFIGNGFFVCRLAHGHIDHIPFLTLPLVLWGLHWLVEVLRGLSGWRRVACGLFAALAMGAVLSVVVDGSPVAVIHYLFWVALYGVVLAVVRRSWIPLGVLALAGVFAALLAAGYLWSMLMEQGHFPRLSRDAFTSPLSLLWFMILPAAGRVLPAPANGHEYSVYLGPVLLWLIWRYRRELAAQIPAEMRRPLLVVTVVSVVMGMGSLAALGVPRWLSLFDLLRPLPGFRSMNVTGRYWGFLALPLSFLAAVAIPLFLRDRRVRRAGVWLGVAFVLQMGFMAAFPGRGMATSVRYEPVAYENLFPPEGADIVYAHGGERIYQYDLISPVKGLLDAYNMGEFIHPDMDPGVRLIRASFVDNDGLRTSQWMAARFLGWNRIRVFFHKEIAPEAVAGKQVLTLYFNQAWHRYWSCEVGRVYAFNGRNMAVDVPLGELGARPIELVFHDPVSELGAKVSRWAWPVWLALMLPACLLLALRQGKRGRSS